jgi:uncharacterized membrane protein YidH (DUF202 family)
MQSCVGGFLFIVGICLLIAGIVDLWKNTTIGLIIIAVGLLLTIGPATLMNFIEDRERRKYR